MTPQLCHQVLVLLAGLILCAAGRMSPQLKKSPSPSPSPSPSTPSPSSSSSAVPQTKECAWPTLLWGDDFDGATLDASSWEYLTGTAYNNEMQYYTSRTENVRLDNGTLVIEARREDMGGMSYTSGRIDTRLKQAFYPGMTSGGTTYPKIRVEARMKLPKGQGLWPAFWLAPNSASCDACGPYGAWPYSGEIDIMEAINDMTYAFGTVHYGGFTSPGVTLYNQGHFRPTSFALGLEWHTYAFEWADNQMWWFIDDIQYYTTHSFSLSDEGWWTSSQTGTPTGPDSPFDAPFYIILNLAVGGNWPGAPDDTTEFPAQLLVDYVRVYGL